MQKNRFIVNDIYDARDIVLRKNFKVFTMIYADEANNYHFSKTLIAHLTLYHVHRNAKEPENIMLSEGMGLEFTGTDFGLKEMIITKIK